MGTEVTRGMKRERVIYWRDEMNDEHSTAKIVPRRIDGSYKYIRTSVWSRVAHFFWYRVIATPIAFLYVKLFHRQKFVGREKLGKYKREGYFIFGNHTHHLCDAVIPSLITLPKDCYVIVHPSNVSMPYLGRVTPSMGALPLPDDRAAYRNFIAAIKKRITDGAAVAVYPEAHIWPYYTGIRPFTDASFSYPVRLGTPVFAFTNVYKRRRLSKKPRIVTYIDGPFLPNDTLRADEARRALRDEVYAAMCERAALSEVEYIKYIKEEDK